MFDPWRRAPVEWHFASSHVPGAGAALQAPVNNGEPSMSIFNKVTKTFQWGQHTVTLETGEIARQSGGAVVVSIEDTVVLATVVARKEAKQGQDFFPLTVDYIEKTYAAGRIPGSFFKREGRPSELETLTSRLIDRPLRPLFPENFYNEVQVIIHVLSLNPEIAADIPALIGASAALGISGIPFNGPIGAARVGYIDGQYVLNPTKAQMADTQMDLVVAGTQAAVLMVESEAKQLSEEVMLGGVVFGHEQGNVAIAAINELIRDAGKPAWDWQAPGLRTRPSSPSLGCRPKARSAAAYQIRSKQARTQARRGGLRRGQGSPGRPRVSIHDRSRSTTSCSRSRRRSSAARSSRGEPRIDGRDTRTVRPIEIRNGVLPRVPTARPVHAAARRRRLSPRPLGTDAIRKRSTRLPASTASTSCCTTTCHRFATGETGRVGTRSDARSGTAGWPSAPSSPCCPTEASFRTRCASSPRSPNRTAPRRWRRSAAAAWRSWTQACR
jgi:polyribonucleotide nucleotidyltransferase